MPSSSSISLLQISQSSESQSQYLQVPPQHHHPQMHRPNLLMRSRTAPQLPAIPNMSPMSLSFMDPFSPSTSRNHRHQQPEIETQNLTHHFTQSTSCLPSPHLNTPPQKHLTWPLCRTAFASLTTKSLPHLPLRPTHLFHRLRGSFSNLSVSKHHHQDQAQSPHQCQNQNQSHNHRHHQRRASGSSEEADSWRMDWDTPFTGEHEGDEYGYRCWEMDAEESCIPGFCLHLPPEISRDRSEIEYLRRLQREAMSAVAVDIMV